MSRNNDDAAVAAFLRSKGVTRCPTACAAPAHAYGAAADRQALRQRADRLEAMLEQKVHQARARAIGIAA